MNEDKDSGEKRGVRIRTHPGLCSASGVCHQWARQLYPLDKDGYIDVHMVDVPPELAALARIGAQVCPEGAITIIELE